MTETWHVAAACSSVDPELFFPDDGTLHAPDAESVCERCPVRETCLGVALAAGEEHGVWGGTTARMRRRIWRGEVEVA